jgi:hypothetical protein
VFNTKANTRTKDINIVVYMSRFLISKIVYYVLSKVNVN